MQGSGLPCFYLPSSQWFLRSDLVKRWVCGAQEQNTEPPFSMTRLYSKPQAFFPTPSPEHHYLIWGRAAGTFNHSCKQGQHHGGATSAVTQGPTLRRAFCCYAISKVLILPLNLCFVCEIRWDSGVWAEGICMHCTSAVLAAPWAQNSGCPTWFRVQQDVSVFHLRLSWGADSPERSYFPFKPGLVLKVEKGPWYSKDMNNQGILSEPLFLLILSVLANHISWKWRHRRKGKS